MEKSVIECPGCHLLLPDQHLDRPARVNASGECFRMFSDLLCYMVSKGDPGFIYQHAVDAYEAQHAGRATRPITVAFGLIGLYLALERGFTGKEVQRAHMKIAGIRRDWPLLEPPSQRAALTVHDVLEVRNGTGKDAMIRRWMAAAWEIWLDRHTWIRTTTDELLHQRNDQPGKLR